MSAVRRCANFHCANDSDGVRVTPNGLLEYCRTCAPVVACQRARIIRQHQQPRVTHAAVRSER